MPGVPLTSIRGIGPAKAAVLESGAAIRTVEDLLYYTPRRYLDRSELKKISDCMSGEEVTISGVIKRAASIWRSREMFEVEVSDLSGTITAVFFSGIRFFSKIFIPGENVLLSGKVSFFRGLQMVHPEFDFLDETSIDRALNTGRIIPLYKSSMELKKAGFDSRGFRRAVMQAIEHYAGTIRDPLSDPILERNRLLPLEKAIRNIHFPESAAHAEEARRRLAFNEIFFIQYYLSLRRMTARKNFSRKSGVRSVALAESFIKNLPFALTADQAKAFDEIINDMRQPFPMNRMLQGDVGSGKTVVAIAASLVCIESGQQAAIMAPTEILAVQHYNTAIKTLPQQVTCGLLTGSTKQSGRNEILNQVKSGACSLLFGTHSLIQEQVNFKDLGLIVIDEQHRFGVQQRATLRSKGSITDLLVMTATPIPRSLSLTIYGDLDISSIKEKPAGRQPVKTLAFPESRLQGVYNSIRRYIDQGCQVYYVLPLIEESEKLDLKSAIETYNHLKKNVFPDRTVLLMHGRLKQNEKDTVMESFRSGAADILVTTTVIEVGVDIPNASVIIIHHAERFGLAQLHQLRGRVGRGEHQSFCVLVHPDNIAENSMERIKTMTETEDGFIIAEKDLQLRGDGQITGTRQHGHSVFEFMDPGTDMELILAARREAALVTERITDPELEILEPGRSWGLHGPGELRTGHILAMLS